MGKLKTLEQANAHRAEVHKRASSLGPVKNGIECPQCKKELYDLEGLLMSDPSKRQIWCKSCNFTDYRIA